jgi:hypothetical protein
MSRFFSEMGNFLQKLSIFGLRWVAQRLDCPSRPKMERAPVILSGVPVQPLIEAVFCPSSRSALDRAGFFGEDEADVRRREEASSRRDRGHWYSYSLLPKELPMPLRKNWSDERW